MEWYEQLGIQVGVAFAKEGFNFIFSKINPKSDEAKKTGLSDPEKASSMAEEKAELEVEKVLKSDPQIGDIEWDKTATLFWLGNDLMWIKDQMFRGSSPARVLQGVEHAMLYAKSLGFGSKSLPHTNLEFAKMILEALPSSDDIQSQIPIIREHYRTVADYIDQIKFYISAKAEINEPDFVKHRAV